MAGDLGEAVKSGRGWREGLRWEMGRCKSQALEQMEGHPSLPICAEGRKGHKLLDSTKYFFDPKGLAYLPW